METRFVSIDAKRITVWGQAGAERASGGGAAVYYTCLPRAPRRPQGGKVLNLEDYRRPAQPAAAPEQAPPRPAQGGRTMRRTRRGLALDFAATAAIVCMALVFAVKFVLL